MKKLRKIALLLLTMAIAVVGVCSLVACGSIAGTYKFQSLKTTQNGVAIELKVGEKFMGLIELTEDYAVFEINEDGTFSVKVMDQDSPKGTWEEKDGEYVFTVGNEPISAKLKGSTLTFSQEGMEFTLKKK